jgi:hypothetical protein
MKAKMGRKEMLSAVRNYSRICLWVMTKITKANPDQNLNKVIFHSQDAHKVETSQKDEETKVNSQIQLTIFSGTVRQVYA